MTGSCRVGGAAMYRRDYMTAMLEGKTRHDPVLGMIEGKFTVSYNWLFIKWLQWPLTRRDTTGFAVQYGYISLGV
jgi:hypothetical protein